MNGNTSIKQPKNHVPEAWNFDALYSKALLYSEKMHEQDAGSRDHILYSCISLELMLRASLSRVSPLLLVETSNTNWSHLFAALGFEPIEKKYVPRSISVSHVIERLAKIYPEFSKEHQDFCKIHTERRNSELHSGENSFSRIKETSWLPNYYQAVNILLSSMDKGLTDILTDDELATSLKRIDALNDKNSDEAQKIVLAHKQVWSNKSDSSRKNAGKQALVWAKKQDGHRVNCPSCNSVGLLYGEPASSPKRSMEEDNVVEKFESLPTSFECIACDLKLSGLSKLTAVGLGERFQTKETFDFADFYEMQDSHYEYEPDNNDGPYYSR